MGRKKKQEIDLSQIKTVKFELNFSVPKEEFDELLRKMAHLESKETPPEDNSKQEEEKEEEKKE